jgi:hypothetical protein
MREPANPYLPSMKSQIQQADGYRYSGENIGGDIGIYKAVQIVEQEPALVRLDSGAAFDPVLQQRQRTRPRKQFRKDSPEKRSDVQPPENRVGARQPSAENHPQNEQRMQEEDGSRECRIEIRSKNSCMHL